MYGMMRFTSRNLRGASLALAVVAASVVGGVALSAKEATRSANVPASAITAEPSAVVSAAVDAWFTDEVWAKVGQVTCLECHKAGGDAEDSRFVLVDPARAQGHDRDAAMARNRQQFEAMTKLRVANEGDAPRILLKVQGKLKHGGKEVLKADSAGYRVLAEFARRTNDPDWAKQALARAAADDKAAGAFFDGVVMLDDRQLLRRVTLSLAGRLPTDRELAEVAAKGRAAFPVLLDSVLKEDAFYDRLREGFNDIFLTLGFDDGAESALAYDHFSTTRLWYQKHDLSAAGDAKAQTQARYKLANDYRQSILGEPMKLIEHIVRNDRPFSEIVTADYIMVSPYSARGYGIFEEVRSQFKNPDDPFEYVPVRLKALKGRNKEQNQESASGFYPHAGILSTFQYLRRYPTTETNRNRLRARMYYLHFLGVDVLEQAARVTDAAAVTAQYAVPTMEASACVVCHKTLDPVAGLFQDYWKFEGVYGRRKGGWFTDMFQAGFEGEDLPPAERWRALQWLGERTVKDPRFAMAMVEHAWYILTGRKVLQMPKDIEDPLFAARRRAYAEQRRQIDAIAQRFAKSNFDFKGVMKDWVASEFYRADGVATAAASPHRRAEMDDLGLVRMLAPEQVERKVAAVFGQRWGRLTEQMAMLYGGIDSKEVTERAADPSGAMGAIQRILSNDVACRQTAADFLKPADQRLLFPNIEPTVLPGKSPEADAQIRRAIVHLHQRILGRYDEPDAKEVDRTFRLFSAIVSDAAARKFDPSEIYFCRQGQAVKDPHYTIRAWRAVVTYLLRQQEFLYE
jgi:hypothetical protein